MKSKCFLISVFFAASIFLQQSCNKKSEPLNSEILSFIVDAKKQEIQLYWKDDQGNIIGSLKNLKTYTDQKNKKLIFAMNGGMYDKNQSPQGLFIQNNEILNTLDSKEGVGNFYLKPNGVFYISTDHSGHIIETAKFKNDKNIQFATQSGPMLIINGNIHPKFQEGSTNVNIRNGVGILPNGEMIFALSKTEINFYDFAKYFQSLGCKNALYLDGLVSRAYLPQEQWLQLDGNFGVIIGVTTL